jgi:guanine nucleotide-binding protein G(i) subunit alpha
MADPLTSIGTTALVTGIVELLAKSISQLHKFHTRWEQADFTFINLIAQLSALKAALTKLEEWMDSNAEEERDLHHQLIMDLEVVITCCRMLAHKIDSEISGLYLDLDNALDTESKAKLVLKNGTLEELQRMVDRQTNALTTLLTACNL